MSQFLSQQFNSIFSGFNQQQNVQSNSQNPKKFRAKILDLYDEIFIHHKPIKTLEINFLHLKVNRNGLFQSVKNAIVTMNSNNHNQHQTILMFNKTFEYCINSLLDEKLLVVQHAFQAELHIPLIIIQ